MMTDTQRTTKLVFTVGLLVVSMKSSVFCFSGCLSLLSNKLKPLEPLTDGIVLFNFTFYNFFTQSSVLEFVLL